MGKKFTIMEAREMSRYKLEVEIGKCAKRMVELGMSHEEACEFVSKLMNIGIAIQEKEVTRIQKLKNLKNLNNYYGKD